MREHSMGETESAEISVVNAGPALGATFLATLKGTIEEPAALLV